MTTQQCTRCHREVPGWEGVHQSDGKGGDLGFVCGRCWAQVLSEHVGKDVPHIELAPITMKTAEGQTHEFHFRYNPVPGILKASELKDGSPEGYEFSVLAEEGEPSASLVGRLLEKIRRGMAHQHLEPCNITTGGLSIKDETVCGRIEWDDEQDGRVPSLVIDGRSISWDQFGRMLMQFEGWQVRMDFLDESEEA